MCVDVTVFCVAHCGYCSERKNQLGHTSAHAKAEAMGLLAAGPSRGFAERMGMVKRCFDGDLTKVRAQLAGTSSSCDVCRLIGARVYACGVRVAARPG